MGASSNDITVALPQRRRRPVNKYLFVFLTGFVIPFIVLLPFTLVNGGILLLTNDFHTQQIPFNMLVTDAVRSGAGFSWLTDLGSSVLGSYSFYNLGSVFFWIGALFPSAVFPYLMLPLICLKFGVASLTSFAYLKQYVKNIDIAVACALMYSFCGFQVFNIFYNHFHDVTAIFPLVLLALDKLCTENKRGFFALAVALSLVTNYVFFVGEVVFIVIYYFVKCRSGDYIFTKKQFFSVTVESLLGVFCGMFLITAVLFTAENPRNGDKLTGIYSLVYGNSVKYLEIFRGLLLPADTPLTDPFYPKDSYTRWASAFAYIPLFSISAAVVCIKKHIDTFARRILIICTVIAVVPLFNSVFYMFNSYYYARWFYMFTLMGILATAITLDNIKNYRRDVKKAIKYLLYIVVILTAAVCLLPAENTRGKVILGLYGNSGLGYPLMYASFGVAGLIYANKLLYARGVKMTVRLIFGVCAVFALNLFTNVFIMTYANRDIHERYLDNFVNSRDLFDDLKTDEFFRIDTSSLPYNAHMWWRMPSMATFNSNIPGSEMEFYDTVGLPRFVATMVSDYAYQLRSLFSVKYAVYEYKPETNTDNPDNNVNDDDFWFGSPRIEGFKPLLMRNNYKVYENTNYIPMGFCYDYYITHSRFNSLPGTQKLPMLLKAIVLEDDDYLDFPYLSPIQDTDNYYLTFYNRFITDCEERRNTSCYEFNASENGFTARIDLSTKNLVFFSVPFDSGFNAYVNGEPAEIYKTNVGFMAVECPAGDNYIEFVYKPKWQGISTAISIVSFSVIIAYILAVNKLPARFIDTVQKRGMRKDKN